MSRTLKVSGALIAAVLLVVLAALVWSASRDASADAADPVATGSSTAASDDAELVRDDSHVLGEEGSTGVTLVEFLDLECEACGSLYPYVEQLREEYEGKVTFVVRYFPISSHANAMNAAVAVEASSQQGRFEEMYSMMYETQSTWGEQQTDQSDTFRGFAEQIGLDLDEYDAAVAAPETQERVEKDQNDGTALGVQGTPTFFLDGEKYEPESMEAFRTALDQAVADAS